MHHSTFIEQHQLTFKTNPDTARKLINAAFTSDSYETRNIYGVEGMERLNANCMMSVLQPIIQKEKPPNHDAIMVLNLFCRKQEIEAVTIDDITRSHAKMLQFFPNMMELEKYAYFVVKCLAVNYAHRFIHMANTASSDNNIFADEFKIAKVLKYFFVNKSPLSEFYPHLEKNKVADRFDSDNNGKLTFRTFKILCDLIDAVKLRWEPCQPGPSLTQSWVAVRN